MLIIVSGKKNKLIKKAEEIEKNIKNSIEINEKRSAIIKNNKLDQLGFENVTGVLTGFGILGTFIGLSLSLCKFNMDLGSDTAQIQQQIVSMINGMKTAFYSSLVGIFLGLIFTGIRSWVKKSLDEKLEKMFPEKNTNTEVQYLKQLCENFSSIGTATEKMNDAATSLKTVADGMIQNINTDSIATTISESIENVFKNVLEPVFQSMNEKFETLKDVKEMTESVKQTNEELKKYITDELYPAISALKTSVDDTNKNISNTIGALYQTTKNINGVNDSLKKNADNINNVSQKWEDSATAMKGVLENFEKQSKDILINTGNEVSRVIKESNEKMQSTLSGVNKGLTQTSSKVMEELGKFREEYTKSLGGYLESQTKVLNDVIGKHIEDLDTSTESLSEALKGSLTKMDNITSRLTTIQSNQELVEKAVKTDLQDIARETLELNTAIYQKIETKQKSLEELQKAILDLNTGSKEELDAHLRDIFKYIKDIVEDLKNVAGVLSDGEDDEFWQ
jgi:uncharacterized phage infection (PIP) family protein YhgE